MLACFDCAAHCESQVFVTYRKRRLTGTARLAKTSGRDKYDRPTAATVIDMFKVRYSFVVS